MITQASRRILMPAVKLGVSRQVAIPKKLHDQLGLSPGDYLEIEVKDNRIILTPKLLVDRRLAEAETDVRKGRVHGPFTTPAAAVKEIRRRRR
jgi:AbrB family looped-hinge helix DNA binding protein